MAEWRAPLAAKEKDDERGIRKRQTKNEGGISEKMRVNWIRGCELGKLHKQKKEGLK